jgi:hypothetical protein
MIEFLTKKIVPKQTISGLRIRIFEEKERVIFRSWHGTLLPEEFISLQNRHKFFLVGKFNKSEVTFSNDRIFIKGNSFTLKNELLAENSETVWVRLHSSWNPSIDPSSITLKNRHLSFNVPKNKICLLIKTREGVFGRTRWMLLPDKLKWKKSTFFNALGLFIAEGHTSKKKTGSLSHVAFSNSDFNLLKIWLEFLDKLIVRSRLKWFFNTKLSKEEVEFWKNECVRELNLNPELFFNWKSKNKSKDGIPVVRVFTCCIILRSVIEKLLGIAIQMAKDRESNTIEFLKGWWAGDGHIINEKSGSLSHFAIRSKNHERLLKKLFRKINVSTGTSKDTIFTHENLEDLIKLIAMRLTSLRSKGVKERDIIEMLETKPSFRVWKETLPLLVQPTTWSGLTKALKKNKDCARARLKSLLNNKLIFVINENKPKKFVLTERGRKILNWINLVSKFH